MKLFRRHHHDKANSTLLAGEIMLGLAVVLLLAAVYIQRQPPKRSIAQTPYANGQTVSMGSAAIKINNVTYSDGTKSFTAPLGQHYIIVDLSVTNTSDQPINIFPASDIYLKKDTGEVSYLTPLELDQPFHAGELLPGETVRGQISYAAGKTSQYKLFVDGIWSGGVIPFSLH